MTILIAVTGGFGSGKSELVNIISNLHGSNKVTTLKFAQPLYDIQKLIQNYLNLPLSKDRNLLQLIGTEWGRKKDPDVWVNQFLNNLDKLKSYYDVIICDDMRYFNEFNALKEKGFLTVKIERFFKFRDLYQGTGINDHSSEMELVLYPCENFDFYIVNNSTYDDFVYQVSEMFLDIIENNKENL